MVEFSQDAYRLTTPSRVWEGSAEGCIIRADGGKTLFSQAKSRIEAYKTGTGEGVKVTYTDFPDVPELEIECRIWQEHATNDVLFELIPLKDAVIKDVIWPGALKFDAPEAMTVLPLMRGVLVKNYTEETYPHIWPTDTVLPENGRYSCSRSMYMQFWGQYDNNGAAVSILETRWDGGMLVETGVERPTAVSARWRESLGKIGYARKLRVCFLPAGSDYNQIAKVYRAYVKANGEFVSLKQKIARNEKLAQLIGRPIVHTHIWYHVQPDSDAYKPDRPELNDRKQTYAQVEEGLKTLRKNGLDRAVLHLDGWCKRGYDNQHPDVLPPNEELGGWEGMRKLQDTCHELGYFFGLHDQYRDYYYDADSFDEELAIHNADGSVPSHSFWYGGKQTVLCQTMAPDYVRRNYREFAANGIHPDNVYLDVFSCVELDECFHPSHIMNREMCAQSRAKCLSEVAAMGTLMQSEEGIDWAFPYLDFVHHAPHAPVEDWWKPDHRAGIPVPLLDLVYHDCLIIP